jgi:hypothetical protein
MELDAGLVHEGLAADGVSRETHTFLERCAREVLDDHVRVVGSAGVDARAGGARLAY